MLNKIFKLNERATTVSTEVLAGLTTFITMAYVLAVMPTMLAGTGMDKVAVFFATCLSAGLISILMGFVVNFPIALAPGMGLGAYFATVAAKQGGIPWELALGAVFISGVIFLIFRVGSGETEQQVFSTPENLFEPVEVSEPDWSVTALTTNSEGDKSTLWIGSESNSQYALYRADTTLKEKAKPEKAAPPRPLPGTVVLDLPEFLGKPARPKDRGKKGEPAWKSGTRALRRERRKPGK